MKAMQSFYLRILALLFTLFIFSSSAMASHTAMLFNEKAMDKVLEMWPDFVETVNNQARGVEELGQRGLIMQSPLRGYINQLLRQQPTPQQYGEGFRVLVEDQYMPAGVTTLASRLNTNQQVTAYKVLLRKEGRLPLRFAYSYDLARQPMTESASAGFYERLGVLWETIEVNPWLWLHGMSSEGDWDSVNRGCMGDDLPVKPGLDAERRREIKEVIEICPDFNSATVQALMRGVGTGWRFAGVHGIGSHGIRLFVQKLEEAMRRNPDMLTLDYVRESRHGFAHGTFTGAVPDVVEAAIKYNLYIPINVRRSLAMEPQHIQQNYGEAGWKFLAPVKTLLDLGVNVVGEIITAGTFTPELYYDVLDTYVNREISIGEESSRLPPETYGEGEVFVPEEGVDRVVAYKLFTHKSSEFLMAETKVGSLEVGKFADFIVTNKDYLSGPDIEVRDNKTIMTVLAGEIKYQDPEYDVTAQ
jgi:hypothetical protein